MGRRLITLFCVVIFGVTVWKLVEWNEGVLLVLVVVATVVVSILAERG